MIGALVVGGLILLYMWNQNRTQQQAMNKSAETTDADELINYLQTT